MTRVDGQDLGRWHLEDHGYSTPCRIWDGPRNQKGYGLVKVGRSSRAAHRAAYEREHGPVPGGYTLDHLCRVRLCVAVDHLEAVPHAINVRRGLRCKLTAEDVALFRALWRERVGASEVARRLGISRGYVHQLAKKVHWTEAS